jgi:hypothetical protein
VLGAVECCEFSRKIIFNELFFFLKKKKERKLGKWKAQASNDQPADSGEDKLKFEGELSWVSGIGVVYIGRVFFSISHRRLRAMTLIGN